MEDQYTVVEELDKLAVAAPRFDLSPLLDALLGKGEPFTSDGVPHMLYRAPIGDGIICDYLPPSKYQDSLLVF